MKKASLFTVCLIFLGAFALSALDEIAIGRVSIPRDFVHEGKDFAKGIYRITLVSKEGTPVFLVKDNQDVLLFEELAVVKPYEGQSKNFKPRIRKEVLKDYEYYRVKVTTPESLYMAYFLLKKNEVAVPGEDQSSPSSSEPK